MDTVRGVYSVFVRLLPKTLSCVDLIAKRCLFVFLCESSVFACKFRVIRSNPVHSIGVVAVEL